MEYIDEDPELRNIRVLFSDAVMFAYSHINDLNLPASKIMYLTEQVKQIRIEYGREILNHVLNKGVNNDFARKVLEWIDRLEEITETLTIPYN